MLKQLFFLITILSASHLSSQQFIDWGILADVEFEEKYDENSGLEILHAKFGGLVQSFDTQEVQISGYVIPLDPLGTTYVLSRNPNASCFFCGGAGPETIIKLALKPEAIKRYRTDDYRNFQGVLELNVSNEREFNYVLRNAEEI